MGVTFYRDDALPFFEAKRCEKSDLAYQKHFHEEHSIGLIDLGETQAWCEGSVWRVDSGRIINFPPNMLHACQPAEEAIWKYKMLFIKPDWLQQIELPSLEILHFPFLLEDNKNEACSVHLNRTINSLTANGTPLEIESELIQLIYVLTSEHEFDLTHKANPALDQKYVKRMKDYIHTYYKERITLEMLEQEIDISRYHLIRLFKSNMGLPPHAYQNLLRINYAKSELKKQKSISQIAVNAGYYDQSHFSKAFMKVVGATPQIYAASI